jgi:hypothetical protein
MIQMSGKPVISNNQLFVCVATDIALTALYLRVVVIMEFGNGHFLILYPWQDNWMIMKEDSINRKKQS